MKGGGGWWWEEKAREGSGEEEVNPTLPLARSAWCGAGWRVQSRAGSLASLSSKSYASPSICDSAKKTSVLWSDVAPKVFVCLFVCLFVCWFFGNPEQLHATSYFESLFGVPQSFCCVALFCGVCVCCREALFY